MIMKEKVIRIIGENTLKLESAVKAEDPKKASMALHVINVSVQAYLAYLGVMDYEFKDVPFESEDN